MTKTPHISRYNCLVWLYQEKYQENYTAKKIYFSFEKCCIKHSSTFCALRNCILLYHVYSFFIFLGGNIFKRETAILKSCAHAIITLSDVIIARCDAILDQSKHAHLYNHRSNYTNINYRFLTLLPTISFRFLLLHCPFSSILSPLTS